MPSEDELQAPPQITVDGEVFSSLMQHTISAATRSAESATRSAAAIDVLSERVAKTNAIAEETCGLLKTFVKMAEDAKNSEREAREERGKWLRALLKPETLYYTCLLIALATGSQVAQSLLSWRPGVVP